MNVPFAVLRAKALAVQGSTEGLTFPDIIAFVTVGASAIL
jgi:hypothetical protein